MLRPPSSTLFPYTTLFRSEQLLGAAQQRVVVQQLRRSGARPRARSEEHTSELQSHSDLVCRLLLEKKKSVIAGGIGAFFEDEARLTSLSARDFGGELTSTP